MHNRLDDQETARLALSTLMDGQSAAAELDRACAAWRHDAEARRCWHRYHLIGDVLRSEELAAAPATDAAFLQSLRVRLADEPVPLAPAPLAQAPTRWRGRMLAPVAAAAGFVAVAGVLVLSRTAAPGGEAAPVLAQGKGPADALVASHQLVRDARLDRYLAAHRQVSNGATALMPGAVVRSVDTVVLEEK